MVINIIILLASLILYTGYGLAGIVELAAICLLSYAIAVLARKNKLILYTGAALVAIALVTIKLTPVIGYSIAAPFGFSYFGLQIISYLCDIAKGKAEPERNILKYALYICYYPHLIVGPVEKYKVFSDSLAERKITADGILNGGIRAVFGAFKKLLIASRIAVIIQTISADSSLYRGSFALAAVILYSVELYADFSGGMDIVLGISEMLGLKMSENFDRPYFSETVSEFWRRWHITLGAFLRDYIYIPLGGNRKGKFRKYINTLITFTVSGLWHGASYIFWGLFNGIFVCTGNLLKTKSKLINRVITYIIITLLWAFFVWNNQILAMKQIASIFSCFNYGELFSGFGMLGLNAPDLIVLAAASLVLWIYDIFSLKIRRHIREAGAAERIAVVCSLAIIVLLLGMYGMGFNAAGFIYSRF